MSSVTKSAGRILGMDLLLAVTETYGLLATWHLHEYKWILWLLGFV